MGRGYTQTLLRCTLSIFNRLQSILKLSEKEKVEERRKMARKSGFIAHRGVIKTVKATFAQKKIYKRNNRRAREAFHSVSDQGILFFLLQTRQQQQFLLSVSGREKKRLSPLQFVLSPKSISISQSHYIATLSQQSFHLFFENAEVERRNFRLMRLCLNFLSLLEGQFN